MIRSRRRPPSSLAKDIPAACDRIDHRQLSIADMHCMAMPRRP